MSRTAAHSVVEPTRASKRIAGTIVVLYALISITPLLWIFATSFKTPPDSIAYPPKICFQPASEAYATHSRPRPGQPPHTFNPCRRALPSWTTFTETHNMAI